MLSPIEEHFYVLVGQRVRARRGELTQERLAALVGVTRTSITNVEKGNQRIPLHFLLRLAAALGCQCADLLPRAEELKQAAGDQLPLASSPFAKMPKKTSAVIRQYGVLTRTQLK